MSLNIAIVGTFFYPVEGGVERAMLETAKELKKKGHNVEVLCSDSDRNGKTLYAPEKIIFGMNIKRFKNIFSISKFHKFFPGIGFYLLRSNFDVIHIHGIRKIESYIALFIGKLKGSKVVLTTHNPFTVEKNSRSVLLNFFIKVHDLIIGKLFIRFFDKIIYLSKDERSILTNRFNCREDKIFMLPNGVADVFFSPPMYSKDQALNLAGYNTDIPQKFSNIVMCVGRYNKVKGFHKLKKSIESLPSTMFILVGAEDGYGEQLNKMYGDYDNVLLTNKYLMPEVVRSLYAISDIFLFPSEHEAFGIAPLEAMVCNCLVISSSNVGFKDFLEENSCVCVNNQDENSWYMELKKHLDNPELRKVFTSKAFTQIDKFRWNTIVNQLEMLYLDKENRTHSGKV